MGPPFGHYIRPNDSSRIPRRHVVIDTEACAVTRGNAQWQSWRCGVAVFLEFTDAGVWRRKTVEYTDVGALWDDVLGFTRAKRRTVLWAHNLAYDLRIADALATLDGRGWVMADIRVESRGTWGRWSNGTRTLIAADTSSIFPTSVEQLGRALGLVKLPLPHGDDMAAWLERCTRDVEITAEALRLYLTWLREQDMGTWQVTGAGQSYGVWRHKHLTHKVLVSDDTRAREAERRAMWTGRAEAWSHGAHPTQPVVDLDWTCAYARIAAEVDVPVKAWSVSRSVSLNTLLTWTRRYAVLAEVTVDTDTPVVPCEHGGFIVWPTGRFDTVLWDPELRLLAEAGARVRVGRVWLYRKAPALKQWADWILGELDKPAGAIPPWRRIVLKHWSRTLIGRFGLRYRTWEEFATSPESHLRVMDGWDTDTDAATRYLQIGHRVLTLGDETEGRDAVPAITGYIMSEARARLWRAADVIGAERVLYVDTDSLLVDTAGRDAYRALACDPRLAGLREKRAFTGWAIAGPRQVVVGGQPRIAGVPRNARQTGPWSFKGEVWRGLGESLRQGEPASVRVTARVFAVRHVDRRRVHGADGRTEPIHLQAEGGERHGLDRAGLTG